MRGNDAKLGNWECSPGGGRTHGASHGPHPLAPLPIEPPNPLEGAGMGEGERKAPELCLYFRPYHVYETGVTRLMSKLFHVE